MNLKIKLTSNFKTQLQAIGFLFFSLLLVSKLIKSEQLFDNFEGFILTSAIVFISAWIALVALKYQTIIINKNFFITTNSFFLKQRYAWKDIVNIEKIHREGSFYGEVLDPGSSYIVLEVTKDNQKITKLNENTNILIRVDNVRFKDESLVGNAFMKTELLTELLVFFKKQYAYVDIHSQEIDRPEVKILTEKLSKLGVSCNFLVD